MDAGGDEDDGVDDDGEEEEEGNKMRSPTPPHFPFVWPWGPWTPCSPPALSATPIPSLGDQFQAYCFRIWQDV